MPREVQKRWHGRHMMITYGLLVVVIAVLFVYEWIAALVASALFVAVLVYSYRAEKAVRREHNKYIATLSQRVKKAGYDIIKEMPIGIIVYGEADGSADRLNVIQWHNPFISKMLSEESVIGVPLEELFPAVQDAQVSGFEFKPGNGRTYEVQIKRAERFLFFYDVSIQNDIMHRYEAEKLAIGMVFLDNLDEATQGMDDQTRSIMFAKITGELNTWSQKHGVFLKRTASDRYMLLMEQQALQQLEQSRFDILDVVRDLTADHKVPCTLSIGVASGMDSLMELGNMAQSSLDIALGRGGDQAAVRVGQRLSFYGGRSNAVEKRTRVRARVISHALRDLIRESDKVIIMGHKLPDMDSIGAAIGVLKAVHVSDKVGYIVLEGINPSIQRMMEVIYAQEDIRRWFITPEEAMEMTTLRTLAVVVDTHKASLVAEPRLLKLTHRVVVIDHHRRGEEFIKNSLLVYMEPYASSTCELVTELLQYIQDKLTMSTLEATSLLAGIVVDTKSFSLRTGTRTFDAASFLRRHGADATLIQQVLQEDLQAYVNKAEIIKNATVMYDHIALVVTEPDRKYSQLMIAQVADTLLNLTHIKASFVISERQDGLIGVSARSLGQMNVQLIMERMGGGGHLTNAATQLRCTLAEAEQQLKQVLEQIEAEEGLFE